MLSNFKKHLSSFDFFRGAMLTVFMFVAIYWGLHTQHYYEAFTICIGVLLGFFPNIEGNNKHRLIGMLVSLAIGTSFIYISTIIYPLHDILYVPILGFMVFSTAMISCFGYRGSMISFSGMFGIVMSFVVINVHLNIHLVVINVLFGGFAYIVVSLLSHFLFQKRNVQILLSESLELTAVYLKTSAWNSEDTNINQQQILLKTQTAINEKHEMLRSILLSKNRQLISSKKSQKQFLMFSEMVNVFEMALANSFDSQDLSEHIGDHKDKLSSISEANSLIINDLEKLSYAMRFNTAFSYNENIETQLENAKNEITEYVKIVGLPTARDGALKMHILLDLEQKQFEKVKLLDRIYNNLQLSEKFVIAKASPFKSPNEYNLNTLKFNLSFNSSIFRHALRLAIAVIVGLLIGRLLDSHQTHWILLTIMVILRPNFGLTKARAMNRVIGTILGGAVALVMVVITKNTIVYGISAVIAMLVGFTYIQKNYRLASAGITLSIILLYVFNVQDPYDTIITRLSYTLIGVVIAYIAMYTLWPIWEKTNIKSALISAIKSNSDYLKIASSYYHTKNAPDTDYKLIRKENLLMNGNLNAAFQRMSEEPKSKQNMVSNYYAAVLLNNTFMSAVASFSAFIQHHKTSEASESFDSVITGIENLLINAQSNLGGSKNITDVNKEQILEALDIIHNKYQKIILERTHEIASGMKEISVEMRTKLQEGKMILDHLKWLLNISENLEEITEGLKG